MLAATFSALAVLPLVFLVQIAFIVAFGVLLDTFVVRSLLVPAAAYDIGPPDLVAAAPARRPEAQESPDAEGAPRLSRMTRVALAGYGFAGRDIHAPLLAEAGCDVVAVSTRNPERAAAARDDIPGVAVVARARRRCSRCPSSTWSCSRPRAAATPRRCARSSTPGCRASSTSPSPSTPASAADVVRYAAASGVPLTVFQNRRFDAEQATVARVVADGLVGTPFRYEMRWERWRPVPKDRWREQRARTEGGGILLDLHSHLVDAAVQLFGPVASGVRHGRRPHHPGRGRRVPRLPARRPGWCRTSAATSLSGAPGPRVRLLGTGAAYVMADFTGEAHVWSGQADADAAHSGWLYRGDEREPVARSGSGQADLYRAVAAALASDDPQARDAGRPVGCRAHPRRDRRRPRVGGAGSGRDRAAPPRTLTGAWVRGWAEAAGLEALLVHRRPRAPASRVTHVGPLAVDLADRLDELGAAVDQADAVVGAVRRRAGCRRPTSRCTVGRRLSSES